MNYWSLTVDDGTEQPKLYYRYNRELLKTEGCQILRKYILEILYITKCTYEH